MLRVYGYDLSNADRTRLKDWLQTAWFVVKEAKGESCGDGEAISYFRIYDLKNEDFDPQDSYQIFAVDRRAHREIIRELNRADFFKDQPLYGANIVAGEYFFFYYSLSFDITDYPSISNEVLNYNWERIFIPMVQKYEEWFPFCDPLPNFSEPAPEQEDVTEATNADPEPVEAVEVAAEEPVQDESQEEAEATSIPEPQFNQERPARVFQSRIDVLEVTTLLWDALNEASGAKMPQTIGQSLNQFEKMVFDTSNGPLVVYPNNRMNKGDEGAKVCIKDLIILLKTASALGSRTIDLVESPNGEAVNS